MSDDFDDDDWQDIERVSSKAPLSPVTILLSKKPRGKYAGGAAIRARATLALRAEFAAWAFANGPRFKLQIGGKLANKIRLVPDAKTGKFEVGNIKGTATIALGHINLWPDEQREHTDARGHIADNYLVVTLPDDFARPKGVAGLLPAPKASPAPLTPAPAKAVAKPARATDEDDAVLRAALGITDHFPQVIGGKHFTPQEARMLEVLLGRAGVTTESLLIASRDPREPTEDDRDIKIVDILIHRIRKKLEPLEIGITREYGGVFRMNAPNKARLRSFVDKARAANGELETAAE